MGKILKFVSGSFDRDNDKAIIMKELTSSAGGGDNGGMEMLQRVVSLESEVKKLRVDVGYIKGKIEDMPSKDWITTRLVFVVGGFTGLLALIGALLRYI